MAANHPDKGKLEVEYLAKFPIIYGVDEVGRGCIAGPVFAASVQIDYIALQGLPEKTRKLIRDSKTLSHKQRLEIKPVIEELAVRSGISSASVREIERFGIVNATFRAMRRAIRVCGDQPDLLLLDGKYPLPRYGREQKAIIGGDSLCYAISAASILAKEARDDYMKRQARRYPHYDFSQNVGYGTAGHIAGLKQHGICPLHRRNFAPISKMTGNDSSPQR